MSGKVKEDNIRSLFFGDYMHPEGERIYDEIIDLRELSRVMEQ
jgi:dynein heavy chain, axonemal